MKILDAVAAMDPPRYTMKQAAKKVGKHPDTLRRWKREGTFTASDSIRCGHLDVPLYSDDDLRAMRRIVKDSKPGPLKATA